MNTMLANLWQFNIELSLILMFVLIARIAVRKTTRVYNAYILWVSIPVGLLLAQIISYLDYAAPKMKPVDYLVQSPIMQPPQSLSGWDGLLILWAGIALALLLRLVVQHIRLRQQLKSIVTTSPLETQSSYPVVGIDKEDFSPAVYGFFKPRIFFPVQLAQTLSATQIRLIVEHEEQHIRQQHLWLNLAWDIAVCLVWFNPLVYLSRQNFRHDQELYCDYLVLNKSNQNASRAYGHALLTTVTATHSVSLLCSWKTFNQIEERIMNIKRPTSVYHKIALCFASVLIVLSMSMYSVSASQHSNEQYRIYVDDDQREVVWQSEDKTYIDRNGTKSVIESHQERAMSKTEQLEFQAKTEQKNLEMKAANKELRRTAARLDKLEHLKYSLASADRAMLEAERIRLESDKKREAIDVERLRIDAERIAIEAHIKQRDALRAKALAKHPERIHKNNDDDISERELRRQKEQAIEEFELSQVEQYSGLNKHGLQVDAQRATQVHNYEHQIESALQSIEGLAVDIELSLKNSNVPIEAQRRLNEQIENAKREIEQSRQQYETNLAVSVVPELSKLASLSQLSGLSKLSGLSQLGQLAELGELAELSKITAPPKVKPIQQIIPPAPMVDPMAAPAYEAQQKQRGAFDYRRSQ